MEGESFADMTLAAQQETELPPVMPSRLPVRQAPPLPRMPFMAGAISLAAVWLVLAFVAYYPGWLNTPGLRSIYGIFGVTTTDGLVFEDVSMQRNSDDAQTQFLLMGSITNHAAETRIVPTVRVQLRNKNGDAIWERKYPVNEPLEAGKPYAFRIENVTTSFAGSVSSIVLDLGHPLQLTMR